MVPILSQDCNYPKEPLREGGSTQSQMMRWFLRSAYISGYYEVYKATTNALKVHCFFGNVIRNVSKL